MVTLRDMFVAELSALRDAEEQILRELPLMAARATSSELRELFQVHYRDTQRHIDRLGVLFEQIDERPRTAVCHGMRGIIEDARERHASRDRGEVLDAALVGEAQRIEHYEIAAYDCARRYANTLGEREAASLLQDSLDDEDRTLQRLSAFAEHDIDQRGVKRSPLTAATPTSLMPGVWVTETSGFASVPPRAQSDLLPAPDGELMVARGEPAAGAVRVQRNQHESRGGATMKERQRNEDARGGDVIVNDSIASGKPDLPIDQDPGRETNVAINADELGRNRVEEVQPPEKRD
jgi:ferritin-like metal-binding protein YciE